MFVSEHVVKSTGVKDLVAAVSEVVTVVAAVAAVANIGWDL